MRFFFTTLLRVLRFKTPVGRNKRTYATMSAISKALISINMKKVKNIPNVTLPINGDKSLSVSMPRIASAIDKKSSLNDL